MSKEESIDNKTMIYVDGKFLGFHHDGAALAKRLREKRRLNEISYQTNVYYRKQTNELFVNTEKGRVRRPYIIVEDAKSKLTPEIYSKLRQEKLKWSHLIKMGIVEYLDADEEENIYVAKTEEEITKEHTHLEIDASTIFGVVASVLPYPEHNSSPRITMAGSMAKQSLGLYAANFNMRYDTRAYVMYYPQMPAVSTDSYNVLQMYRRPAGQNFIVAITSYKGWNMADSVVVNKGAIDRGLGRAMMFRTYETEEVRYPGGQKDSIEIPNPNVQGYRGEEVYKFLDEDGIVIPESQVKEKDVLVGKTSPPRFLDEVSIFGAIEDKKRESSLTVKGGEYGKVDSVVVAEAPTGNRLVKARLRVPKVPEIGDKFASRHGQKGVIGLITKQEDMPFTKDGVVPDLIINPHAIPSRMTSGHLLEMLGGKAAALAGRTMDGTAFSSDKDDKYSQILKEHGFEEYGEEELYDGVTGKKMKAKIFLGVIYYRKLHHLVSNKMHARSRGPVQLLTAQPTEGRAREGGLKFGEMERDTLIGFGASMVIKDRLMEESDKSLQLVCSECGSVSYKDFTKGYNVCPICGTGNVHEVEIAYAFKLLIDEIKSMGIFPRIVVDKKANMEWGG